LKRKGVDSIRNGSAETFGQIRPYLNAIVEIRIEIYHQKNYTKELSFWNKIEYENDTMAKKDVMSLTADGAGH
jgi:hypothetical protein